MGTKKNTLFISIILVLITMVAILGACLFLFFNSQQDDSETEAEIEQTENQTQKGPYEEEFEEEFDEYYEDYEEDYEEISDELSGSQTVTMYVANVSNAVYLRNQPEENSSNIILTIPLGAQVLWLGDETPVFSKVSYGGNTGYVKRDLLSLTPPKANQTSQQTQTTNTTVYKYMYVANVKNSIYLRSSTQGNQSNILTSIPVGTRIGFIEYANNGFSKIKYNGTIGYVKTAYLSDNYYDPQDDYMIVCNVEKSIYLRNTPYENSNNIICQIPVGSVVRFISNAGGGFYKISWDGYVGYSKSAYLR